MEQKVLYGVMRKVCKYSELYDRETGGIAHPEHGEILSAHPSNADAEEVKLKLCERRNVLLQGGYYRHQEAAFRELKDTHYYVHLVEAIPVVLTSLRPF